MSFRKDAAARFRSCSASRQWPCPEKPAVRRRCTLNSVAPAFAPGASFAPGDDFSGRPMRFAILAIVSALLAACAAEKEVAARQVPLYPGETAEIRVLINKWADHYQVPRELVHKVVQRESDYRPRARNGPYYGMMQILPETARGMGFRGSANELLDADTNLQWAVKYLRGAWMLSYGNMDDAVMWYARGYYYEARDRCLLVETELRTREVAKHCR